VRTTAPQDVMGSVRHPDRFFIDGQWVAPSTTDVIDVVDPATESVFLSVAEAKEADIARAIDAARRAFDDGPWPRLSHGERAEYLRAFAREVREHSQTLGRLWTTEMGILAAYAVAGMPSVADTFDYYAGLADSFEFVTRHQPTGGGEVGLLIREPVGVVGAIVPWNGPANLMAYKTAPALLAGCTVVVKASPEAPGEAYIFAEIAERIGLPPGVLNIVTADREASESLVTDPRVDKVTFTGSTAAGRRIGSLLGGRIARYTLELGGKSAAVLLDDYDVETFAATLAQTACLMTGQVCASLTRVVVSRERHDQVAEALAATMSAVQVGDPFEASSQMGPLAMRRQRDRVETYIEKGRAEGAKLVTGGGRPSHLDRGFYVEPTVFAEVDNSSTIAQEEIFGPVLSVIAADDEDDAIRIANDTVYGLNASVFTDDVDRALAVARRLRSGTVGHNAQRVDFGIAFGGVKQSGVGREGGIEGLLPFLESKTVILDGEPSTGA
jgi:aldehyde dehydrogenase (NAD+)